MTSLNAAELTVLAGVIDGGQLNAEDDREHYRLATSSSTGLLVGWPAEPDKQYELWLAHQRTRLRQLDSNDDRLRFHYLQLGGNFFFDRQQQGWAPLVAGGLGLTHLQSSQSSALYPAFSLAIGGRGKLSDRLGIRLELRLIGTLVDTQTTVLCNGGCRLRIEGDALYQVQGSMGLAYRF